MFINVSLTSCWTNICSCWWFATPLSSSDITVMHYLWPVSDTGTRAFATSSTTNNHSSRKSPARGGVLPMWWVIHMCRGFDPLFSLWQDRARSFWGTFSHPPTAKLSFGVQKLPIFTKIDLFGPKFNFFLDLFGSNFQRPAAHPHQFSGRVPPPPPPPPRGLQPGHVPGYSPATSYRRSTIRSLWCELRQVGVTIDLVAESARAFYILFYT